MLSLDYIKSENQRVAIEAAKKNLTPYLVEQEDLDIWNKSFKSFPFPYIGDYRPKGWELVDTLFCDSSGFGASYEPALTVEKLLKRLKVGYGYAIVEAGQFQVYLGEFRKI